MKVSRVRMIFFEQSWVKILFYKDVFINIQMDMAIIIMFSVREIKPSGTSLPPPTQAQFKSRFSIYTALMMEMAPMVDTIRAAGAASHVRMPAIISTPGSRLNKRIDVRVRNVAAGDKIVLNEAGGKGHEIL